MDYITEDPIDMQQLIECVPNFSEGRNESIINAIADAVRSVTSVALLHVDTGYDANRTVMTFVGPPQQVTEAAFKAIKKAAELIDMRIHKGEHPRIGATDVCPLIPLQGISLAETAHHAQILGKRVGEELRIPVYLYEAAALTSTRKNLASIRSGEYEGLNKKIKSPEWKPDFGSDTFNAASGATIIGARDFLIAFNVNLDTTSLTAASEIAAEIRESGKKITDREGHVQHIPGRLKAVKAIGWYMKEFGKAQVSMNITDFHTTPVHIAFEEVKSVAQKKGVKITGSELVGLIPLACLIDAGKFYLKKDGETSETESEIVQAAIKGLGLSDVKLFVPEARIIEYRMARQSDIQSA